jgi:REP element-mobilizing transposase RayT
MNSDEDVLLEPIHTGSYDLSYTCLLIPHISSPQLKGEVAKRLPQWMQKICATYNWQIEFVTVRADYFQWGLRADPSMQPGQFMQEIRKKTSEFILSNFEQIRSETSSSDFWAPGYLVVLGTRPHSTEMVEQYIRLSHRQQASFSR